MREKYGNVNIRVMYNISLKGPVKLRAHVSAYQWNEDLSYEHVDSQMLSFPVILEYREYISYYDKSFGEAICYPESLFITSDIFIKRAYCF